MANAKFIVRSTEISSGGEIYHLEHRNIVRRGNISAGAQKYRPEGKYIIRSAEISPGEKIPPGVQNISPCN
ncbi:hypothetical protein CIL05_01845 [Virgibacillus profundi]|uniref:Uncharacterized protein n=1 Tax=Virgibacillus profundi TaxID=2024555 RepID=A0A2A2IHE2_9BACI|nr:hypothetical protein CIL05_01845 [Virgibacillus profundi]PXY55607.1 hypothetical protein CIT14_01855 [Virgibacillus profundi]